MSNDLSHYDQAFMGHPKPLKGLFFTELWERFSYYGIRPLLILYMAALTTNGGLGLDRPTASAIVGLFAGSMYLITIFGGWIADRWLGQEKSVWYGSILIALGHLSIALTAIFSNFFFYLGLILVVLGSGLFKTCISVIVGTLYKAQDSRCDAGFSIFYMGINLGSIVAPLLTGLFIENHGWHIGFGIGGIGMLISLVIFRFMTIPQLKQFNTLNGDDHTWAKPCNYSRNAPKVVIIFLTILTIIIAAVALGIIQLNPIVMVTYLSFIICLALVGYFGYFLLFANLNSTEKKQIVICFLLLIAAALFWSAFEQAPTSFNLFAEDFTNRNVLGFEIPTVWFQSINPALVVLFAPIIAWIWVKLGRSQRDPNYITKFAIALCFAAGGFLLMTFASQSVIDHHGNLVSPLWLIGAYFLLTLGELCLSPVGLSAMTKLAPNIIRGQMMGLWFTAAALGNLMAGLIGGHVSPDEIQNLPTLFMRCVIALLLGAIILWLLRSPIQKLLNQTNLSKDQTSTSAETL